MVNKTGDEVNQDKSGQLLNQKQLAAVRGCSAAYLSRMTKEGRIVFADPVLKLYDPVDVAARLSSTGDVRQAVAAQTRRDARVADAPAMALPVADGEAFEDEPEYTGDAHTDFKIASAFEKREAARMARIERMELEKSVGPVADMEREAYTEARIIRDTLLGSFATKLAPVLAPITDVFELEQRLREALREALHGMVRSIEAGEGA